MKLFIPETLKVGFQKRDNCYATGLLAYITYLDTEGKHKKKESWESWRDKNIDFLDIANSPTEGFVLNKHGGGGRGWDSRSSFIRVWDPRDFEFEISLENLLFILKESDCSKGKGLEGKFVYAWGETDLVLLPVSSEDYKESKQFTNLKDKRVFAKELKEGFTYEFKDMSTAVYLGKFPLNYCKDIYRESYAESYVTENHYLFYNKTKNAITFHVVRDLKKIAQVCLETLDLNYALAVDALNTSVYTSKPISLFLKEIEDTSFEYRRFTYVETSIGIEEWCYMGDSQNTQSLYHTRYATRQAIYTIKNGSIHKNYDNSSKSIYNPAIRNYSYRSQNMPWIVYPLTQLWCKLANGKETVYIPNTAPTTFSINTVGDPE